MTSTIYKLLFFVLLNQLFATGTFAGDKTFVFDRKPGVPQKPLKPAATPFEKQFVTDTGATNCPCAEFSKTVKLMQMSAQDHLVFKFNLSKWPKELQSSARMWIAVGAPANISADGMLGLTFSQNGVGMSTDLNNTYNVDGTMVLGTDYAVTNGEVTVDVKNQTSLPKIKISVCVIAYVPEKTAVSKTSK